MKALVIGGTGATGKPLVAELLNDASFTAVHLFVRKPIALTHPKLVVQVVAFEDMQQWQSLIQGDVVFSCMGTTIKIAKTKARQWQIDYEYPLIFATYAKQNGCEQHILVSAYGADAKSKVFYSRMKGALETALIALNFERNLVFKPGILQRKDSDRFMEKAAVRLLHFLTKWGFYERYRPLATEDLALAMVHASKGKTKGTTYYALDMIKKLA